MHLFLNQSTRYRDRQEAGQALARHLGQTCDTNDAIVLALPRGGVPVGREVADALGAPLDIFVVRKLGVPGRPELALGAVASGGIRLLDDVLIQQEGLGPQTIEDLTAAELAELERREAVYRDGRPLREVARKRVVLVDDGVATGYTMRVAVLALRRLQPAQIVVAVPVGAPETCVALAVSADEVVCPLQPAPFHAVGVWYDHFPQLTDEQVTETLAHRSPARR